ncbi:hypothetical protein WJX72_012442 [[Myrmecia] bisecta]|uniref:Uncharacterized protein n=1 Tax=[Myrmecia] bisecta TaxID=41462 RepID=A0AAW1QU27_9CHLO
MWQSSGTRALPNCLPAASCSLCGRASSGKGGSWATSEDIFNLEEGWSLDVLGDDAHAEASFAMDEDEEEGLGMAARSILASMPAHKLHALEADQDAADEANAALKANERRSAAAERKTHNRLRIISGTAAGKRIRSSRGEQTRPMMEKVRGAVFDMLLSHAGGTGQFPANARWLDLFAGTGSVGIEALSRGCGQAHFIELDRWVVDSVLAPNLESCGVVAKATVHTMKAEDFLRRSAELVRFAGGAFDYISVCPPYLLVSYPELFQLLETSPLVHKDTVIVVEYPKRSAHEIPDQVKNLARVRDRQYGRTFVAIFAAEE